jgi:hypothetical protein
LFRSGVASYAMTVVSVHAFFVRRL